MNQNTFTVLFIIISGLIGFVINEYWEGVVLSKGIVVFMMIAYFAGRYSTRLPKK